MGYFKKEAKVITVLVIYPVVAGIVGAFVLRNATRTAAISYLLVSSLLLALILYAISRQK